MTVLLVDDHEMYRRALHACLDRADGIRVVGVASDGTTAISRAAALRPDVVVLDLHLPDLHAAEVTREIKRQSPQTRVLVLSGLVDDTQRAELLSAGALDLMDKSLSVEQIVTAIRSAVPRT